MVPGGRKVLPGGLGRFRLAVLRLCQAIMLLSTLLWEGCVKQWCYTWVRRCCAMNG